MYSLGDGGKEKKHPKINQDKRLQTVQSAEVRRDLGLTAKQRNRCNRKENFQVTTTVTVTKLSKHVYRRQKVPLLIATQWRVITNILKHICRS